MGFSDTWFPAIPCSVGYTIKDVIDHPGRAALSQGSLGYEPKERSWLNH